ncbi:hypothetical protein KC901_03525 [Patescibacteria group bacterium]|nr:hypothetical protein [Patescibacteria group bacterium]MCA9353226.1 hypothetical protein [Patescibacteria group bacterium]
MKGTKTLITVVVLALLAVAGYVFYGSLQKLNSEQTNYEFTPGQDIMMDDVESDPVLETRFETEAELETVIESQESQETQTDQQFDELENLDF